MAFAAVRTSRSRRRRQPWQCQPARSARKHPGEAAKRQRGALCPPVPPARINRAQSKNARRALPNPVRQSRLHNGPPAKPPAETAAVDRDRAWSRKARRKRTRPRTKRQKIASQAFATAAESRVQSQQESRTPSREESPAATP